MRVKFVGHHGAPSFTLIPEHDDDFAILALASDFSQHHPEYEFKIHSHSYSDGKVLSLHFGYGKKHIATAPIFTENDLNCEN